MHVVTSFHKEYAMQQIQVLFKFAVGLDLIQEDGSRDTLIVN